MAKFCTNCGKKLKDGETCDCKKDTTVSSNEMVNDVLEISKGMFVKPIDTIKDNTKEDKFNLSMILVGIMSLMAGLFGMAVLKNLVAAAMGTMSSMTGFGSSSYLMDSFTSSFELPYARVFFTCLIVVFALSFVFAGILYLVNTVMFKGKANFKTIYSLYGVISVITTTTLALGALVLFVNIYVGMIVIALGAILKSVYVYHGIKFIGPKDENKYGYIYLITNVLFIIVVSIVLSIIL